MCNQRSNEQAETVEHASPLHLYIVVDCKTKNCRADHVLTYLGEKGKTPASVEYWMSYPLLIECPIGGNTCDYSEDKFRQKELPPPPPRTLTARAVSMTRSSPTRLKPQTSGQKRKRTRTVSSARIASNAVARSP
jgi:hypothetical protein